MFTQVIPVTTAREMFEAVTSRSQKADLIIKAAAVADYLPREVSDEKVKKSDQDLSIAMERTDDILGYLGEHKKDGQFLCGFSMETEHLLENSRKKLEKKHSGYDHRQQPESPGRRLRDRHQCSDADHKRPGDQPSHYVQRRTGLRDPGSYIGDVVFLKIPRPRLKIPCPFLN